MTALADRPRCGYCHKPLRLWTKYLFFRLQELTEHELRENANPNAWGRYVKVAKLPQTKAEAQRHSNQTVVSIRRLKKGEASYWKGSAVHDQHGGGIERASTWDGVHFHDGMFCSGPCSDKFARAAYRAGYRMTKKESA